MVEDVLTLSERGAMNILPQSARILSKYESIKGKEKIL